MKKNKVTKMMAALGVAALMLGSLTGCGSSNDTAAQATQQDAAETTTEDATAEAETAAETTEETEQPAEETTDKAVSGTITMAGSTSMEKLANAVAESFMAKYPDVTVTAEFTGSSAGVEAVLGGSVDMKRKQPVQWKIS